MKHFFTVLMIILLGWCANDAFAVKTQSVSTPTTLSFVASDDTEAVAEQAEKPLNWRDRAKASDLRKKMRWYCLAGILICVGVFFGLRKETKKRNLDSTLYATYVPALVVLVDCLFFFNMLCWLFPLAFFMTFIFPLYYLNWGKGWMITLSVVWAILLTRMCIVFVDVLTEIPFVFGFVIWGISMFFYAGYIWMYTRMICPHCKYFANHEVINTTFDGEELRTQTYTETHYGDERTYRGFMSDYKGRSKTTTSNIYTYLDKHYTDTHICDHCNKIFTLKRTESEEVDSDIQTSTKTERNFFQYRFLSALIHTFIAIYLHISFFCCTFALDFKILRPVPPDLIRHQNSPLPNAPNRAFPEADQDRTTGLLDHLKTTNL